MIPKNQIIPQLFSEDSWKPSFEHDYFRKETDIVTSGDVLLKSQRYDSRNNFKRNLTNSLGIFDIEELYCLQLLIHNTNVQLRLLFEEKNQAARIQKAKEIEVTLNQEADALKKSIQELANRNDLIGYEKAIEHALSALDHAQESIIAAS